MDESAWHEVATAVAGAPYRVEVLPAGRERAAACLAALEITTRSWLGAVVGHAGGLLVDGGWLRVLGCGHEGDRGHLPDVVAATAAAGGRLIVGVDVLGGRYAWQPAYPGATPTVHYFGPDEPGWQDLEQGYAGWLDAVLGGALPEFYDTLRWPGWAAEVAALRLDQGLDLEPPPWTPAGRDVAAAARRPAPLTDVIARLDAAGR